MTKLGAEFDPLFGEWNVKHHRLRETFVESDDWQEFLGVSATRPILGGLGNLEDNVINFPGGSFRAVAMRSFDVATGKWAIWWCDQRNPHNMDTPIIGEFIDGVGVFYGDHVIGGKPIKVRFYWKDITTSTPHWEQAFSADDGRTWETCWTMDFTKK